jgi:hypothetical protein
MKPPNDDLYQTVARMVRLERPPTGLPRRSPDIDSRSRF